MRVLVAYATKYGATAEIAEQIAKTLTEAGLDVDLERAQDVGALDRYSAVVLGSAVYAAPRPRWRREAARLLARRELAQRDVWLFSSGPVGDGAGEGGEKLDQWTEPKRIERLAEQIKAHEHVVFGGRVSDSGGFLRKSMAKNTAREYWDMRDWGAIEAFAHNIASALRSGGARS